MSTKHPRTTLTTHTTPYSHHNTYLLTGMGFSSWVDKRITPRLVFYVLGRKSAVSGINNDSSSRNDALINSSSSSSSTSGNSNRIAISRNSSSSRGPIAHTDTSSSRNRDHHNKNKNNSSTDKKDEWYTHACTRLDTNLSPAIKAHFTQSFDHVPPTEFCLSLRPFISTSN